MSESIFIGMNEQLLRRYIKSILESMARVPNQLVDTEDSEKTNKKEKEADDVKEFSAMGTGAVVGYMAPLGATAQDMGVKRKAKRKKDHWY